MHGPPKVVLLAVDLHEDFIAIESVAVAPVLTLQSPRINSAELDAPKANRFAADSDAAQPTYLQYPSG